MNSSPFLPVRLISAEKVVSSGPLSVGLHVACIILHLSTMMACQVHHASIGLEYAYISSANMSHGVSGFGTLENA